MPTSSMLGCRAWPLIFAPIVGFTPHLWLHPRKILTSGNPVEALPSGLFALTGILAEVSEVPDTDSHDKGGASTCAFSDIRRAEAGITTAMGSTRKPFR